MKKLVLSVLLLAMPALGDDQGQQLYGSCIACHGDKGQGNPALNAPALAGQDAAYIARQLQHFKLGVRGGSPEDALGAQMRPMSAVLGSDAEVEAVAAYLAALPTVPASGDLPEGDLRNGENQYNGACGACHGGQAQGNASLNSPRLAGLDLAYLKRQYQNFASGIRGSHPDDRLGAQMKMMSTVLASEKDIDDVMLFITSQGR